eukprot:3151943-Prymnesium_polylepis.1
MDGTFKVNLAFFTRWHDPAFATTAYADVVNREVTATTKPIVAVDNYVEVIQGDDDALMLFSGHGKEAAVTLRRNASDGEGQMQVGLHVTARFRETFELREFPFDVQSLTIPIRMWGAGVEQTQDYGRFLLGTIKSWPDDHPEWIVHAPAVRTVGALHEKQKVEFTIILQRKSVHYIRTIVLPLAGLTSMTFVAFMLEPDELNDRMSIIITMLLTVVAFKLVIADKLPSLAYSTRLDTYMDLCFVTILAVSLACVYDASPYKGLSTVGLGGLGSGSAYACAVLWLL